MQIRNCYRLCLIHSQFTSHYGTKCREISIIFAILLFQIRLVVAIKEVINQPANALYYENQSHYP